MKPYMTSFGIPIVAKFENCNNIEQVKEVLPKKVAKLLQDGHLPSVTKHLQINARVTP